MTQNSAPAEDDEAPQGSEVTAYAIQNSSAILFNAGCYQELIRRALDKSAQALLRSWLSADSLLLVRFAADALRGAVALADPVALVLCALHLGKQITEARSAAIERSLTDDGDIATVPAALTDLARNDRIVWLLLLAWRCRDNGDLSISGDLLRLLDSERLVFKDVDHRNIADFLLASVAEVDPPRVAALHAVLVVEHIEHHRTCLTASALSASGYPDLAASVTKRDGGGIKEHFVTALLGREEGPGSAGRPDLPGLIGLIVLVKLGVLVHGPMASMTLQAVIEAQGGGAAAAAIDDAWRRLEPSTKLQDRLAADVGAILSAFDLSTDLGVACVLRVAELALERGDDQLSAAVLVWLADAADFAGDPSVHIAGALVELDAREQARQLIARRTLIPAERQNMEDFRSLAIGYCFAAILRTEGAIPESMTDLFRAALHGPASEAILTAIAASKGSGPATIIALTEGLGFNAAVIAATQGTAPSDEDLKEIRRLVRDRLAQATLLNEIAIATMRAGPHDGDDLAAERAGRILEQGIQVTTAKPIDISEPNQYIIFGLAVSSAIDGASRLPGHRARRHLRKLWQLGKRWIREPEHSPIDMVYRGQFQHVTEQFTRSTKFTEGRSQVICRMGHALLRVGNVAGAQFALDAAPRSKESKELAVALAEDQARRGYLNKAIDMAQSMEPPWNVAALCRLALLADKIDKPGTAERVRTQLDDTLNVSDPWNRIKLQTELAVSFAKGGAVSDGERLAADIVKRFALLRPQDFSETQGNLGAMSVPVLPHLISESEARQAIAWRLFNGRLKTGAFRVLEGAAPTGESMVTLAQNIADAGEWSDAISFVDLWLQHAGSVDGAVQVSFGTALAVASTSKDPTAVLTLLLSALPLKAGDR